MRETSETFLAASPTISNNRTMASENIESLSRSVRLRFSAKLTARRAASNMWRKKKPSSCRGILYLRFSEHSIAEMAIQRIRSIEVYFASEYFGKFCLQVYEGKARYVTRLELYKHVDVAFGTEVIAQHRPEQRQLADMMAATEICHFLARNIDLYPAVHGCYTILTTQH